MASDNSNDPFPNRLSSSILRESTIEADVPEYSPSEHSVTFDSHFIQLTEPKNQKQLGTCTSFAVASIVEHAYGLNDLSEAYFTVYVESQKGQDGKAGLTIAEGMKYAKKHGLVEEEYWRYEDYYKAVAKKHHLNSLKWLSDKEADKLNDNILVDIPPNIEDHPKYKLSKVEFIFNRPRFAVIDALFNRAKKDRKKLKAIKEIIARDIPVIVSVPVYSGAEWDSGSITKPQESRLASLFGHLELSTENAAPQQRGWHAIVLCGFDNKKKIFKFKNSWGTDWGQGGFGTISYDYIKEFCDLAMYGTKY